jgi:CheY-like chemotaxis protein
MPPQNKRIELPMDQSGVETKNILLLEDDVEFNAAIKDYLGVYLYNVVSVKNGVEGVKEVMRLNFDLIICDMMMPKLPGDMFYLAVERLKPALRNRFIFITGNRGNPTVTNFLKNVDTVVLEKPFQLSDLLEAIMIVESKPRLSY